MSLMKAPSLICALSLKRTLVNRSPPVSRPVCGAARFVRPNCTLLMVSANEYRCLGHFVCDGGVNELMNTCLADDAVAEKTLWTTQG